MRVNIEAERGRMQITKGELARRLAITQKTYNGYIAGTPIPSTVLISMADMFGCSTDYLLGLTDKRTTA